MKQIFIFFAVSILVFIQTSNAQDIIYQKSGDEIKAKVKEITLSEILYQHPDSLMGATFSLPKTEAFMIRYANGTTELIKISPPTDTLNANLATVHSPQDMYLKGRSDARRHYKGRGVFWGSAAAGAATLFTAGVSLAVPLALSVTPPKPGNLNMPDPALVQNPDYLHGYKKQAHRRKIGKAAVGAGTGVLTSVVLFTAVVIAVLL